MTLVAAGGPGLTIPDLSDQRTFADGVPHEAFAELLRKPGLYWQPTDVGTSNGGYWVVTRWADIVAIERDPATFTSTRGGAYPMTNQPADNPSADNLMMVDPPRHAYLRRAAAKGFSPRVVANFDPWVRAIVRDVIAGVADKTEFDFVAEFARVIPAYVIADVLGVPRADRDKTVAWTLAIFEATQQGNEQSSISPGFVKTLGEIQAYAAEIQRSKRENPGDDMCTALTGCVDRGEINQAEFLQWMFLIMVAGFETTHTAIAQSMRMYLEDPEVRELTDRSLDEDMIGRAVDEYFRLISPPMEMARTATRDVEFGGDQISEGDVMVLYYIAANRDPAVFSEPDRFNPWRAERESLAFGTGVHRCIGSHLAKLEVKILWEELRAAGLNLRLNGTPKRGWSVFINELRELPVARV
jgi:cytochrome P450